MKFDATTGQDVPSPFVRQREIFERHVDRDIADGVLTPEEIRTIEEQFERRFVDRHERTERRFIVLRRRVPIPDAELTDDQRSVVKGNVLDAMILRGQPNLAAAIENGAGLPIPVPVGDGGDLVIDTRTLNRGVAVLQRIASSSEYNDWLGRGEKNTHEATFGDERGRSLGVRQALALLVDGGTVRLETVRNDVTERYKVRPGQVGWHVRTKAVHTDRTDVGSVHELLAWWTDTGEPWLMQSGVTK